MIRIEKLTKPGSLQQWLEDSVKEGQDTFALDLETTGLTRNDKIISGAVTGPAENEVAFFGPEMLHELLQAPTGVTYVFHNASFDLKFLAWASVDICSKFQYADTLIFAHLLNENGDHGLGSLVLNYYGDNYKEEFWKKYKTAQEAPESELAEYNAKDVAYTRRIYSELNNRLSEDGIPTSLLEHVHRLQRSLLDTEIKGLPVDVPYLMQKGVDLKTRIEGLLPEMRSLVADEISII